jgi:FKBP-type peptidyl-prolyl cis-trans isomerase 2
MIKENDWISIEYEGKFEDGKVFDSSKEKPLIFKVGSGMIIPGLDEEVVNMAVGDKKTITIPCEKAYGPLSDQVMDIPKSAFGDFDNFVEDTELQFVSSMGPILLKIIKINEDSISATVNHPLAGKTLIFDIEIKKILTEEESKEQEEKFNNFREQIEKLHHAEEECSCENCSECAESCQGSVSSDSQEDCE